MKNALLASECWLLLKCSCPMILTWNSPISNKTFYVLVLLKIIPTVNDHGVKLASNLR